MSPFFLAALATMNARTLDEVRQCDALLQQGAFDVSVDTLAAASTPGRPPAPTLCSGPYVD